MLVLGIFVMPLAAEAQQAGRTPRVGLLVTGPPAGADPLVAAFRQGLRERGYVEGQNVVIAARFSDGVQRLPDLAAELVRINVEVIVTQGTPAAQAARRATATIPIVMATSGDPVAVGLVASLARPGGNVTGNSLLGPDLAGKRLELLREIVPGVSRIAVVSNPTNPAHALHMRALVLEAAARTLGVELHPLEVRSPDDFERVFQAATSARAGALLVFGDPLFTAHRTRIANLAARSRLPTIYELSGFAEVGGLMNYGADLHEMFRRAAAYVDKILKGARPADLPIEQPTKFDLVINLKTAKALGLTIPQSVLIRADRIIQ
jgi:putative ABC transport system substrate-binding protein